MSHEKQSNKVIKEVKLRSRMIKAQAHWGVPIWEIHSLQIATGCRVTCFLENVAKRGQTWPNVTKRDQTWPNLTKRDQTWPNSLSAWHFSSSKPLGDFWSRDQSYIHTDKMSRSYFIKHIKQVSQDICQTNQCLKIICVWLILIAKRFPKGLNSPYAKQICEVSEPSGFRSPLLLTWSPPIWVTDSLLAQSPGSKGLDGAQPDTSAPVASESCKIF